MSRRRDGKGVGRVPGGATAGKPSRDRRTAACGFTLTEMMVTLVVTGFLAAGIVALLIRNNAFYGTNDDAIFAEQTVRAAVELVGSELRAAGAGDLVAAESDSVALRFDLSRAVVCATDGTDETTLYVYDQVTNANLPGGAAAAAFSREGVFLHDDDDSWSWTVVETGNDGSSPTPKEECVDLSGGQTEPTADWDDVYIRVSGWSSHSEGVPDHGAIVRSYGILSYDFDPSSFGAGEALWRNNQELVAPFDPASSRFEYRISGVWQDAVAAANLPDVTRIRLVATAVGEGGNRYGVEREMAFEIPLRNQ